MTRDVKMVMYGGWGLKMFLVPLFKIPCWLSNILLIIIHPVTLISVYVPTFLEEWIFVFGGHKKVFDGMTSFDMYFNPILFGNTLVTFTQIHSSRKVGSYTDISVTGWIVIRSILESQQEILKRGTRNILRPHPPYMTILTSLVMMSQLTIFPYWGERTKTSWEP